MPNLEKTLLAAFFIISLAYSGFKIQNLLRENERLKSTLQVLTSTIEYAYNAKQPLIKIGTCKGKWHIFYGQEVTFSKYDEPIAIQGRWFKGKDKGGKEVFMPDYFMNECSHPEYFEVK